MTLVVTRLSVCCCDATKVSQFQRNVLHDVAEVSTFFEPRHEAARLAESTMMTLQVGKKREEPLVETFKLTTLPVVQFFEIQAHEEHRAIAKNIRTRQRANAFYIHEFVPPC